MFSATFANSSKTPTFKRRTSAAGGSSSPGNGNSPVTSVKNGSVKKQYQCGVCRRRVDFSEAYKCKDCSVDLICFNCISSHIAQEHKVLETSGYPPSICPEHKFVETLYCTTDLKTFCLLCQSKHTEHQLGSIRTKVAECRSTVGRMMNDTNDLAEFLARETRKSTRILENCREDAWLFHEENTHESVVNVIREPLRELWTEYDQRMDESRELLKDHHSKVTLRKSTVSGILAELKDILPHDDAKVINLTQEQSPSLQTRIDKETEENKERFLCTQMAQYKPMTLEEKQAKIKEVLALCFPSIHLPSLVYTSCVEPKSFVKLEPPIADFPSMNDPIVVPAQGGFFTVDFDTQSNGLKTMSVSVNDVKKNANTMKVSESKTFSLKTSQNPFVCPSSTAKSRLYVLDEHNSACYIEGQSKNGYDFVLERQNFSSNYKFVDSFLPGHAIFYRHKENERFYTMVNYEVTDEKKQISWLVNQTTKVALQCSDFPPIHFSSFAAERYTSRLAFIESPLNVRIIHMKSEEARVDRDFSVPTCHLGLTSLDFVAFFNEDKLAVVDKHKKEATFLEFTKEQHGEHELCGWKPRVIVGLDSNLADSDEILDAFNVGSVNGSILLLLRSGLVCRLDWQDE
ncbi:uncharacterized protein LOC142338551 isoform X2 [Convolutriloba macropyga]|uniref:uncharacterized protein LOC142338551 isoform X2 n=1 Tax=Convolutriloba macropyga TaxID=536237 RepID=UPI003F527CCB